MKTIFAVIMLAVLAVSVIGLLFVDTNPDTPKTETSISEPVIIEPVSEPAPSPAPSPEPEPVSIPTTSQTGLGFSVNVSGDMHDKSFFTVSGTIPDQPRHLTGTIRTGEGDALKIVYVFQMKLDNGINVFEQKVGISEDFLWQEDTTYIVSINHGEIIKEIEFYRGTTLNNFEDSVVPIV